MQKQVKKKIHIQFTSLESSIYPTAKLWILIFKKQSIAAAVRYEAAIRIACMQISGNLPSFNKF